MVPLCREVSFRKARDPGGFLFRISDEEPYNGAALNASTLFLFILGFVSLYGGGEFLVRGASRIARSLGISSLVIGLTVVAFGTSAPELAVSVRASSLGIADIAAGNVVGSNIFNILVILGLSALAAPLNVPRHILRRDVPVLILCSFLLLGFALKGDISRFQGVLLLLGILAYTAVCYMTGREKREFTCEAYPWIFQKSRLLQHGWDILFILSGIALLVLGARWMVSSGVELARWMGVSELVIGLTLIAAGTSLPELATSVVASIHREREIAVGNAVGSSIFNILCVLGAAALVRPLPVSPDLLRLNLPVMVGAAIVCVPVFATGRRISRGEGVFFLLAYAAYVLFLFRIL